MTISATDVKNLREKTGAGMMDCKKALAEAGGDFEKAVDFLKQQGLAKAVKKGDRVAAEGLIFSKIAANNGVMLELNCETDFVAKNDDFLKLGTELVDTVLSAKSKDVAALLSAKSGAQTVEEKINSLIAVIGEKISLRRFEVVAPKAGGRVGAYIHTGGKIVVMLEVTGGAAITDEVIRSLGMQVAAMNPQYTDKADVPADLIAREKAIQLEALKESGKPAEILEKIVVGKLDKFASEMTLLHQAYVKDPSGKKTVAQFLKETDANAKVVQFVRYQVGEGIEKKKDDFAEEVAKMAGQG
jgi:elongation factor Ts